MVAWRVARFHISAQHGIILTLALESGSMEVPRISLKWEETLFHLPFSLKKKKKKKIALAIQTGMNEFVFFSLQYTFVQTSISLRQLKHYNADFSSKYCQLESPGHIPLLGLGTLLGEGFPFSPLNLGICNSLVDRRDLMYLQHVCREKSSSCDRKRDLNNGEQKIWTLDLQLLREEH